MQSEVCYFSIFYHLQLANSKSTNAGVLIECDPSVKAIILKYDEERHDYIVEDLDDDRHLVIKESQLENLKFRLGKVRVATMEIHFLLVLLADRIADLDLSCGGLGTR